MPISRKITEQIGRASWIRRMFEEGLALMKRIGEANVFDFSLGNPILEPPVEFFEIPRRFGGAVPKPLKIGRHSPSARARDQQVSVIMEEQRFELGIATFALRVGGNAAVGAECRALGLGRHLYEQEYFEEAQGLLRKAIDQDSEANVNDRREARMLLAILAHVSRDFGEAERLVKEALSLGPDPEEQPRLLFVLGRTYVSAGRQEEGVATFEVIVRQFPQSQMAQKAKETLTTLRRRR